MIAAAMISVNSFAQAEGEANAKLGSVPETVAPKADVPDADTSLVASDRPIKLGESVVTSFRTPRKVMEMPASLALAGKYDYLKNSSFTVASTLNYEPGIALASDGVWATSVNVRGLGEQRLVTLVDGDRVETATDLTASLSMIDVNDIERVEIVKGAQSVLYGTGAMGGIVNVITKDGHFADNTYFGGNVTSGYASVNNYFSEHAAFMAGGKKWYARVAGTYGKAGNAMTPKGVLENSQFNTSNIDAKFGFKPVANHLLKLQFQRNYSWNVGIPGGSAFPGTATATYTGISRTLFDASYEISKITDKFSSLKFSYFHQDIQRNVLMLPNSEVTAKLPTGGTQVTRPDSITPKASHITNGGQIQGTFNLSENNTLIAGIDVWNRRMSSTREKYITMSVFKPNGDLFKENKLIRYETPLPTSTFTSAGIYVQDEAHLLDGRLTLTAGGRIDDIYVTNVKCYDVDSIYVNKVKNPKISQRTTFEAGKKNDVSWSASFGALYKLGERTDVTLNLARSYRAASLEERFKYIDLTSKVRLGDPNLKPENGYSADLGLRYWGDRLSMQASAYVNSISNMIVETPGVFVYSLTGSATEKKDTLPALVNANVSKALLYGFDFKAEYSVVPNLTFLLTGTYVRGLNTAENTNLPMIPPMNGRFGVRYTFPKIGTAELSVLGVAAAKNIASGETATDGYYRLDFALNTRRFDFGGVCGLQFFAGVDNITNVAYRNFLATNRGTMVYEPGRNIFIRANFDF